MKLVPIIFIFGAVYIYCSARGALALLEDKKQYEAMTFDLLLRGSWMLDHCAMSLFNCYEIVKADVMCTNLKYFSSVCAIQRDYCHNQWGMRDDYSHTYQLYEKICLDKTYESMTRRFALRLRLRGRGPGRGYQ